MAQPVTLKGKDFYVENEKFYPMVVNYGTLGLYNTNGEYFLASDHNYNADNGSGCDSWTTCSDKIQLEFDSISRMGFNTVRLGFCPDYIKGDGLITKFGRRGDLIIPCNPLDTSDLCMRIILSIYDEILRLANATMPHPLKVILVMKGDKTILSETEISLRNDFLAAAAKHLNSSIHSNAILAYDIFNEPAYHIDSASVYGKTKQEACEIISTWYDIIKTNAPQHLVTVGNCGMDDIWSFDPSLLKVDFNSEHCYPDFKSFENRADPATQELARIRTANRLYWFNQTSVVPWIVGETGFHASRYWGVKNGLNGDTIDFQNYIDFSLNAVCNCGGSGYSWWQYKDVRWSDTLHPNFGRNFYGLLERHEYWQPSNPPPNPFIKKPGVDIFKNYVPQITGACPTSYSPVFDENNPYYNPWQHPPSPEKEIGRYVFDQYGNPIRDAVVKVWTSFGMDTIKKYTLNGVVRDTLYAVGRTDVYDTHTDVTGYFKAIPSPRYGFEGTPQKIDSAIAMIWVSAAGANIFESDWNSEDGPTIRDTIKLNKIKDNVVISGETVLNGQTKAYKGRKSLTVSNTNIHTGGNATFTSQRSITLHPGFVAHAGSQVKISIAPPDCNETPLRQTSIEEIFDHQKNKTVASNSSTKSNEIELLFELDLSENYISIFPNPTNSTATIQLHSKNYETSLNSIKIYDLLGREILSKQVNENSFTIDLSSYPKGVYFIEVKDRNTSYYQKIINQ